MNKANESFSAFLDGEATELDIQRLLNAMDEQPQVSRDWHKLSKVKASLQGDTLTDVGLSISPAVEADIPQKNRSPFLKRLMQGGIAAAVAVVTISIVSVQNADAPQSSVAELTVETPEESSVAQMQQQFAAQQRLTQFLKTHAEQASFTTGHVVVPAELNWVEGAQ